MNLIEALGSINQTKTNIIRDSIAPEAAAKLYPSFPVARSLSYAFDCVILVNELNIRGTPQHGLTPQQHYEFLLNVISKKKRYNKWEKSELTEDINAIMQVFGYSSDRAREILSILTPSQIDMLKDQTTKRENHEFKSKRKSR